MRGRGSNMSGLTELKFQQLVRQANQLLNETRNFSNTMGFMMLRASVVGMQGMTPDADAKLYLTQCLCDLKKIQITVMGVRSQFQGIERSLPVGHRQQVRGVLKRAEKELWPLRERFEKEANDTLARARTGVTTAGDPLGDSLMALVAVVDTSVQAIGCWLEGRNNRASSES